MLRSYEYSEQQYTDIRLQDDRYFATEKQYAGEFVEKHLSREISEYCPVCDDRNVQPFFVKWGVIYYRCEKCGSIYMRCDAKMLKAYKTYEPMLSLRLSEEYQADATNMRDETWTDFLAWLAVRTFRFLHKKEGLDIIDVGNRYEGFSSKIASTELCGRYERIKSILGDTPNCEINKADIVLYLNQLQQSLNPAEDLNELRSLLKDDGLLILNTRAGSGFDILTLKGRNEKIFPYEHVLLPSVDGLVTILGRTGYKVLEVTTPGVMDMNYILANKGSVPRDDLFARYLVENAEPSALQEFQRFLQKYCLSSFVQIIARKEK